MKRDNRYLTAIFLSDLFLSFHIYLILYINSSFLEQFFSPQALSGLFIAGSILNLILLFKSSKLIKKYGNYSLTLIFILLELFAILGLALSEKALLVALFFLLHQAIIMMILFNFDIFLEDYSKDESETGRIRAMYLTIASIIAVICPTITGLVLNQNDFGRVYFLSSLFLLPVFIIIKKGLHRPLKEVRETDILKTFRELKQNRDVLNIFLTQLVLNFFYAWMVIYVPIHLSQNIGFGWDKIGLIFTIMLLPFALFEIPLGKLADKKLGEKEILISGFGVLIFATALIPFLREANFILWALLLFSTRVGASFIEISSESYFFKHVGPKDSNIISFFRMARPISFILAPFTAAITFIALNNFNINYGFSFLVLAFICLFGILFGLKIHDTR